MDPMRTTIISIIVAILLIAGALVLSQGSNVSVVDGNNVSIVDGVQIIEINAKGGYQPRESIAKAGIPTLIRFNTAGTFDCSSAVRIPSLDISQVLPASGVTDIDIGAQQVSTLQGTCGMGMYPFQIEFKG